MATDSIVYALSHFFLLPLMTLPLLCQVERINSGTNIYAFFIKTIKNSCSQNTSLPDFSFPFLFFFFDKKLWEDILQTLENYLVNV